MSEIRATTISDLAGTGPATLTKQSAAKAWVDISGTPSINDSLNVSSVTDNGTGLFQPNWTNVFSTANYATVAMGGGSSVTPYFIGWYARPASSVSTAGAEHSNTVVDVSRAIVAHGDLA